MRRSLPLSVTILFAVTALTLALTNHSAPTLNSREAQTTVQPVTARLAQFNSSSADGATLTDPIGWLGSNPTQAREVMDGGRLIVNRYGQTTFEVLPLFTTAGATASIQIFSCTYLDANKVPTAAQAGLVKPSLDTNAAIGSAYNRALDAAKTTFTIQATSQTIKLSNNGRFFYPDSNGTTYYVGTRLIFDLDGSFAEFPYVVSISNGTLVLLARTI